MNNTVRLPLILASQSPRRRTLLEQIGFPIRIVQPTVTEQRRPNEPAGEYAVRNAREKAHSVLPLVGGGRTGRAGRHIVIAADTLVVLDDRILEKPRDAAHARAMLRTLSGRRHDVITGLCVLATRTDAEPEERALAVRTEVEFRTLNARNIDGYIATGEPMDKAGAYAVQGAAGFMVRSLHGSHSNVIGLPLSELVDILEGDFGCRPFA